MNSVSKNTRKRITVHPNLFRQFGDASESTFYLITNSHLREVLVVEENANYKDYKILTHDPGDSFSRLIEEKTDEPAHIVVITPN
jgi:hypothetical protein